MIGCANGTVALTMTRASVSGASLVGLRQTRDNIPQGRIYLNARAEDVTWLLIPVIYR